MRLIILTQYYPPETGAPQNRLSDLAKRLVKLGHDVTVFTAMPNYPSGRIHDGYQKRIHLCQIMEGITVHRSWVFATKSHKILPRLINYFSFVFSSLLIGALCLRRADFLLTESPPLFLGISGYVLSKLKRAKLVMNISDLWPKAAADMKVVTNEWLLRRASWLEEFLYRRAALVTGQTRGIVDDIQQRLPHKEVRLLTNGADLECFKPERADAACSRALGLEGRFVVGYAGIHGLAQSLDKVVDAGDHLRDYPEIVIAFFGDGPLKGQLQEQAREKNLNNVRFFPTQPREHMPGLVASWGAGVVPLYTGALARGALPSKMFELMAAGVPVLLSAPRGEATSLIDAAEGGVCVEPENPAALARAILTLYRDPSRRNQLGRSARAYVSRYYNRQSIAEQFLTYLIQVDPQAAITMKAFSA
jgi:glycosyltransferase involved in cell wall biosynthesis